MLRTKSVLIVGLVIWTLILSAFAQGTRITFPYTKSFSKADEKTRLLHDVSWNLTLRLDFIFPVDIATQTNATDVEPNDCVEVNATATAPENEAYSEIAVNGELNVSGPQVNRDLGFENSTEIHFTTPIGEETINFEPLEISNEPELYAIILEPSITFYTSVHAETSTEGCSVVSGASPEWHSNGETATTIVRIEGEEGDTAKLDLIDFTYYLGASITVTVKLRILAQEVELDTWLFTIPEKTVPASDTIPLAWDVIPEFAFVALMIAFILATSAILIIRRNWQFRILRNGKMV